MRPQRETFEIEGADAQKGAFFMPTLLYCDRPLTSKAVHSVEAFGPVSTVLPYRNLEEAMELALLGDGSLAGSIATNDNEIARELVLSLNTVRTHTKNIYTKLGVNNRRAAVRRATELGLLHARR